MSEVFYLKSTKYLIPIFAGIFAAGLVGYLFSGNYYVFGLLSFIALFIVLLFSFITLKEEEVVAKEVKKGKHGEIIAVEEIVPTSEIIALKPSVLLLKIKNPLKTYGLRLRFRTYDYVNPKILEIPIAPGETTTEDVIIIPTGAGEREFSISIAPLFDENGKYIPPHEADDIEDQDFKFEAEEYIAGGLSHKQRSLLSTLIRFALFFSASGLVYLSILRFSGLEALIFVLTEVMPILMLYQVPALMLAFWLDKKLPEKPTFVFHGGE